MDPGWTVMTSGSVTRMDARLDQVFVWKEAALVWLGCDGGAGDGGALHVVGYSHQGCQRILCNALHTLYPCDGGNST